MIKKTLLGAGVLLLVLVVLLATVIVANLAPDLPAAEVDQRYTSNASQFVLLDNKARVHFRDEGEPEGPALVLVHGYSDSLHTWEEWVRILSDEFRIVSVDVPAHGLTGRVPDDDYTPAAMVAAIHGVVTALKMERFSIAGNSMGGQISWLYTATHPDRVEKLVLLDASGYRDHRPPPSWVKVLRFPGVAAVFRHISPKPLLESGWKSAFVGQSHVTPELLQRLEDMIRREGTRRALRIRRENWPTTDPMETLRTIQRPTLILWGDRDVLVPPEHAELFNRDIANSRVIMYENVGHLPMQEIPERSAEDVRRFLLGAEPKQGS